MDKKSKRARQFLYYTGHILSGLMPKFFYRRRLEAKLAGMDRDRADWIMDRVSYCNQVDEPFVVSEGATRCRDIRAKGHTTYYYDLLDVLRYFDDTMKVEYVFGDVRRVPDCPSFVKSRPIGLGNENSILLKLNRLRHFNFVKDDTPFLEKRNAAVWRGKCSSKPARLEFVARYAAAPDCNIGDSSKKSAGTPGYKGYLSIRDQLMYKFIISIEGNDVASNLKWIMSSNSLCLMPRPRYETWFCEGRLVPDHHYVLLKDDVSDLEEKMEYYTANGREALEIIENANRYVDGFRNPRDEELIALLVAEKYFRLSGQMK